MREILTFRSLQKLRFYLAGVFPFLARPARIDATSRWLERNPTLARWWTVLRDSALGANIRRLTTTFALGNFADKQLDWATIPREAAAILRSVIILGTLLCLLVPVAIEFARPALPQESITGIAGPPVAGWSIWLWMTAYALGWSCLLAGAAAASRVAFVPALVLFIFFSVTTVAALPKSWWNILVALQAAVALALCEARQSRGHGAAFFARWSAALLAGAVTAFALLVATPVTGLVRGHLVLAVALVGTALGVALRSLGGRIARRSHTDASSSGVRLDAVVALLASLHFLLLMTLVARGGLAAPARGIATFAVSFTGYLWPLYYFLGIGVVFKVLRQTKSVHTAATELIPARYFVSVCVALLLGLTLIGWSEAVVARPALPWPGWLRAPAEWLYSISTWMWSRPLTGITMGPMRWVFFGALIVAAWAAIRRRLTSGVAAGLLFVTLLLWLAIFEYFFEYTGFSRSYRHTAFSLLVFSVFVLWLTHRTLLDFLIGSSLWWPRAARIAIYAAGVLFVLMPLHARAALHDNILPNEIFLYLFFGVIDLGLPYYLFVYAEKRFKELPLSVPALLGLFAIGAVLSVPLIVFDKLAASGWSLSAMWARATAQEAGLLQGAPLPALQVFLPPAWIVIRGIVTIGVMALVAARVKRRALDVRLAPAAAIAAVVAVGAGLASFSNRSVELPLVPVRVAQLITPLQTSLAVDASLIARHLSYLLPALLLGLVLSGQSSRRKILLGIFAALSLHVGLALFWPAREAWLRSIGAVALAGSAGVMLFVWLTAAARDRLDEVLVPKADAASDPDLSPKLLLTPDLRWASATVLLLLALAVTYRAYARRLVPHAVASSTAHFPFDWRDAGTDSRSLVLTATSYTTLKPRLWAEVLSYEAGKTRNLLQNVAMQTSEQLQGYTPTKLEQWNQYYPGALALEFRYAVTPGDTGTYALGTTALAPMPNGQAFVATVVYGPSDSGRHWDLARALLALPR